MRIKSPCSAIRSNNNFNRFLWIISIENIEFEIILDDGSDHRRRKPAQEWRRSLPFRVSSCAHCHSRNERPQDCSGGANRIVTVVRESRWSNAALSLA
jgi:hypothetical protein